MKYRPLTEADIAGISRVHRQACLIAYSFMGWDYSEQAVHDWYAEKFRTWDWGLVAEDKEVVGFVTTSGALLDQLFVEPGHQGAGIGTVLLTTAIARMPPSITLNVLEGNVAAQQFYQRHGFWQINRFFDENDQAFVLVYGRDGTISG
jgi:GNAT superfamily N-acetyltransferase